MNKKYIDFVPAKGANGKEVKAKSTGVSGGSARVEKSTIKKSRIVYRSMPESSLAGVRQVERGQKADGGVQFGVIEDLNTKFVSSEIEKRPLGGKQEKKQDELKEVKSRRLLGRKTKKTDVKSVEKPVENSNKKSGANVASGANKSTYKMPKSPFINQSKVVKRPLSKNVYQKPVETPTENPSGPVTIIAKPEKDKSISLVVTIIITIILGAAAGTVAFLLLPK